MTITETNNFLERIKQHYQEFVIDKFKIVEWHQKLKDYDYSEVNAKLDEHLNNESYGDKIPKVYFLVRYLKTFEQKKKSENTIRYVRCNLCGDNIQFSQYENHYERCSSVNYVIKQSKKYLKKNLDRNNLMSMSNADFEKKYNKLLEYIMKNSDNENEIKLICNILKDTNYQISLSW